MRPCLVIPVALVSLAGCRQESPERRIQQAFDRTVVAIEASDAAKAIEVLSESFRGPDGMTRGEAQLYLMGLFRQEKVGITVFSSRIAVNGSRATQTAEVVLTSRAGGRILPQEASRRTFLLDWEERNDAWRVRSLEESPRP